ncbi:MAG: PAS domain S-box protein [Gammaproteobacteria bacterium]|nr:PAS domain S-box protein [Gammaproteobacteria bacterium]
MIFNRLRNSPGLFMVTLIIIIPMAIMGYLLYSEVEGRIQSLASEQLGLRYVAQIQPVIQHIQQHRGMSGAFLNGDESFRQKMLNKQSEIDEFFSSLVEMDNSLGRKLETGDRAQDVIDKWGSLKLEVFTMRSEKSYTDQTKLVSTLIDLITHVADTSGLLYDSDPDSFTMIDLIVTQMPILSEGMGQSRAIGMAVAANAKISTKDKIQLAVRLDRIQRAETKFENHLALVFQENPRLKKSLAAQGQIASGLVIVFSRLIEDQLLNAQSITVSTDDVFNSSTAAINALFDTYTTIIPEIERLFSERLLEARQTQTIALILIVGALLLVFIISFAFYKTLNRFKVSLDMTNDCVLMFSPESLKFFYVNQAAIEQVGFSSAELMNMTPMDISQDFDELSLREMLTPLREHKQVTLNFETNLRHKDGHPIPTEIMLQHIHPKGEQAHFVAVVRNITERKVMQEQVQLRATESQESQQRFTFAIEGTGDGIWDWDLSIDSFEFSKNYSEMLGYNVHELPHHIDTWVDSIHPDDLTRVQQELQDYLKGKIPTYSVELRLRCKDGSYKWILSRGTVASRDDDGKPLRMIGMHSDITERKLAEVELNRFKATLDMTKDSVFMYEPDNFKFFYVNQGGMEELGYSEAELMDMTPLDINPDFDEEHFRKTIAPLIGGQESSLIVESHHQHKDGHIIPVEISLQYIKPEGQSARFVAMVRNITERIESQARLRETEERTHLLLESVVEGIYGLDTNGRATFVNPAVCEMLGYTEEEMIGKNMHNLIHHSYADGSRYPRKDCPMYAAFVDGVSNTVDNEVLWRKDGTSFPAEYTSTPIRKDGELVGAVITFHNISERIENEQALVSARDQADHANRAKSEFLSSMSHELRTPMNAILGFAQILEYEDELSEDNVDSVHEILKAGNHLLDLINEVLDLAKIESGHIDLSLEPVEVCPVIHDCLSLVSPLAEQRGVKIIHKGSEGTTVRADRTRLKQVLLNLLSNAIKYNREGGSVTIDMQPKDENRLLIRVTDTGPGIPAERLEELFLPFNRLDAEGGNIEGTGIGLTITRRIIELMGGSVDLESEVGVGSRFWIELPLESLPELASDDQQSLVDSATPEESSAVAENLVLYIEDNPANLKLVAQLLGRRKHIKLLTAHTPELGIELAQSHRPKLILLDINMPDMDGYQVLEVFKDDAQLKNIPTVAITANAMPRDIKRGMEAGFTDYLTKPLDVPQFLAVIDSHLDIV